MSKSSGNVIDPLKVCEKYSTDSLRFTFLHMGSMGQDVNVSMDKFRSGRNFCNKLWNAARYILMSAPKPQSIDISSLDPAALDLKDRWILSQLKRLTDDTRQLMDDFDLNEAIQRIYAFMWHDFCDWYIEMSKEPLRGEPGPQRQATETILHAVLRAGIVLLHPFTPFITEEIWSNLPGARGTILEAGYPQVDWTPDADAEDAVSFLQEVVRAIRDIRADLGVPPSGKVDANLITDQDGRAAALEAQAEHIRVLAGVDHLTVNHKRDTDKRHMSALAAGVEIFVPVDEERTREELARLNKKHDQFQADFERIERKLNNESFTAKAPPEVVEKERGKYNELKRDIEKLENRMGLLSVD